LAALILPPMTALSAPIVRGVGVVSCEKWTAARTQNKENTDRRELETWLRGYVSGFNVFYLGDGDIAAGFSNPALDQWVDKYCQKHAQDTLQTAVTRLIETLERKSSAARKRTTPSSQTARAPQPAPSVVLQMPPEVDVQSEPRSFLMDCVTDRIAGIMDTTCSGTEFWC
jgi:hypothetical protein